LLRTSTDLEGVELIGNVLGRAKIRHELIFAERFVRGRIVIEVEGYAAGAAVDTLALKSGEELYGITSKCHEAPIASLGTLLQDEPVNARALFTL
jgi:hypothetical protein